MPELELVEVPAPDDPMPDELLELVLPAVPPGPFMPLLEPFVVDPFVPEPEPRLLPGDEAEVFVDEPDEVELGALLELEPLLGMVLELLELGLDGEVFPLESLESHPARPTNTKQEAVAISRDFKSDLGFMAQRWGEYGDSSDLTAHRGSGLWAPL